MSFQKCSDIKTLITYVVKLLVEAARVTEILARPVPAPEGRGGGPAVDTLPPQLAPPTASTEGTHLPPAGGCQLSIK